MGEAASAYNATLWAVRSPWEITCFRVRLDNVHGSIVMTSVHDLNGMAGSTGSDTEVHKRLQDRYGSEIHITVVADGGTGYEYFRRELMAGRYPVPPVLEPSEQPGTGGQQRLWEEPPTKPRARSGRDAMDNMLQELRQFRIDTNRDLRQSAEKGMGAAVGLRLDVSKVGPESLPV
jgi:hypothetical protein